MTLRRLASISMLTASFAFIMAGSTGCVVRGRAGGGGGGHAASSCEHHCHPKNQRPGHFRGCHAHCHNRGHH